MIKMKVRKFNDGGIASVLIRNGFSIDDSGNITDPSGNSVGNINDKSGLQLFGLFSERLADSNISNDSLQTLPISQLSNSIPTLQSSIGSPTVTNTRQDAPNILKQLSNAASGTISSVRGPLGLLGAGIQTASSNPENISIAGSTIGASLQGLAGGGLLGGLLGGASGFASAVNNKVDFEENLRTERQNKLLNSTVQPFGGFFNDGGITGALTGIQTEEFESLLFPNGTLSEVAAKGEHEDMSKDKVTDLVPPNTRVFSSEREFNPSSIKDDLNILGFDHDRYEEGSIPREIQEIKFTDIVGEDKISFADASRIISKKYPVNMDNKQDIITKETNRRNIENRSKLFNILYDIQEKGKKGKSKGNVQKFNDGGLFLANDAIFNNLFNDIISDIDLLQEDVNNEFQLGQQEARSLNNRLVGSNILNTAVNVGGALGQSTTVDPVLQDSSFANLAFRQVPNSVIDSQISQLRGQQNSLASGLLNSGVDPNRVAPLLAQSQDSALRAESQLRGNLILDRVNTDRQRGSFLQSIRNSNSAAITNAGNQERLNRNRQIANVANSLSSGIQGDASLASLSTANNRRNREQFLASSFNLEQARRDARLRRGVFNAQDQVLRSRLLGALGQPINTIQPVQPFQPVVDEFDFEGLIDGIFTGDEFSNLG